MAVSLPPALCSIDLADFELTVRRMLLQRYLHLSPEQLFCQHPRRLAQLSPAELANLLKSAKIEVCRLVDRVTPKDCCL